MILVYIVANYVIFLNWIYTWFQKNEKLNTKTSFG